MVDLPSDLTEKRWPVPCDGISLSNPRKGQTKTRYVYIDALPPSGLIGAAPDVARLVLTYRNGSELEVCESCRNKMQR